ncbi:MAG: spermidine synthase [Guyparkeria sp.]
MKHRVLERQRDEYGTLEVTERGGEVALHFGNETDQSAWRPDTPERLSFAYYKAMTLPVALHPNPSRVAVLGLGGGVMAKFLLEHTESSIHATDLRPSLGPIAARHFGLDLDHPRLDVAFADITDPQWVPGWTRIDLLLMDVFDEAGMVALPDGTVDKLAESLDAGGLVCVNVWRNTMRAVVDIHRQLSAHFHQDALVAHVPDRLNSVMIYRRQPWTPADLEAGVTRMANAPAALRRAQGEAWRWLQPLRGHPETP